MSPFQSAPLALLPLFCLLLIGCGKDITRDAIPPPPPTSITGNWIVSNVSFPQAPTILGTRSIGGTLTLTTTQTQTQTGIQTTNTLAAIFHIDTPCFGSDATPVLLSGYLQADSTFTLTSQASGGETISLQGRFNEAGDAFDQGQLEIHGPCTGDLVAQTGDQKGAILNPVGNRVPSVSGDWEFFPGFPGPSVSEQLKQASTPDANGNFALTGAVSVTGSPCFTSGTLQPGSYVSGISGQQIILMNDGSTFRSPIVLYLPGTLSGKVTLQLYPGNVSGGQCNGPESIDLLSS